FLFFFFSSRRRHTRWPRDWSSDVCSSDLPGHLLLHRGGIRTKPKRVAADFDRSWRKFRRWRMLGIIEQALPIRRGGLGQLYLDRSEERRVGKECSAGWSP